MARMQKGWFTAAELNIVGECVAGTMLKRSDLLMGTICRGVIRDLKLLPTSTNRTTSPRTAKAMKAPKAMRIPAKVMKAMK